MDILKKGHFGEVQKGRLTLSTEEALYLIDMRNAQCLSGASAVSFNEI